MRTNIEIDDELMKEAMETSGAATKKGAVEQALRMLVKSHKQQKIRSLFGRVEWVGDLDKMRSNEKWDDADAASQKSVPSRSAVRSSRKKAA